MNAKVTDNIAQLTDRLAEMQTESDRLKKQFERVCIQEHLYRSIFDRAVLGIMVLGVDGKIINVNQAAEYMFGCPVDDLKDYTINDFIMPEDRDADSELLRDVIAGNRNYYHVEQRYVRNDGMPFWSLVTVFAVWSETGVVNVIQTLEDITARKSVELQLERESTHDAMTGLYNRAYFDREFESIQQSIRLPVSLVVVDVDGLKHLNDTKGHEAGDRLIVSVAAILKEAFRDGDTVARSGGDEFSIILPETGEKQLQEVMASLVKCHARFNDDHPDFQVHFSAGWGTALKATDIPKTLKLADKRMYANKAINKSRRAA